MRRWTAVAGIAGLMAAGPSPAADPPDPLAAKKAAWQGALDRDPFRPPEADAGVLFSLSQYGGDCKVRMTYDPSNRGRLALEFERDGKAVLALAGHAGSAFRTVGNVLYFAHYPTSASGCTVAAYDLTTGQTLWETRLGAVGDPPHSAYANRVAMGLSSLSGVDKEGEGVVSITGRESFGDYVEILDRATGTVLARKVYRRGFGPAK